MPGAIAADVDRRTDVVTTLVHVALWGSVLFNLVLCFVDTNVRVLSSREVIAVEIVILAMVVALPFALPGRVASRWDLLFAVLVINWLLLSVLRGSADPKLVRDLVIIPIFIVAGLSTRDRAIHVSVFWLHIVVFVFALWEAFALESFVSVFSVASYFEHTRGLQADEWWISNGLYLSSVRPEARFMFPALDIHRLSSVFLEPVSLGNYVIIATAWLATFWRRLPRWMVVVGAVVTMFLLVGSDSRLGLIVCALVLTACLAIRWLPTSLPLAIPPLVVAGMFAAVAVLGWRPGIDNFSGRVAYSAGVFGKFDLSDFAGTTVDKLEMTADAGFAYIVNIQSLLGAIVLWLFLFAYRPVSLEGRRMHLALALYLSLNLVVSWSLFSIKTAGLLWFLFGRALREDRDQAEAGAAGGSVEERSSSSR